ncbi:hypothetical protein B0H14DRAFT_2342531, partial [Mycena olivaceomarginata]
YDGVCSDPIAFGSLLDLDAPPKWKMHKYAVPELEEIMGFIKASVRCFFRARVSAISSPHHAPFSDTILFI